MNRDNIDWLKAIFKKNSMFSSLSDKETNILIDHMERLNYLKGDVLLKEGEVGNWFFIIQKGEIGIFRKKWLFKKEEIGKLASEDFFGEMALLNSGTCSATLVANEDTVCFVLFKTQFTALLEKNSMFKDEIQNLIASRQSGNNDNAE